MLEVVTYNSNDLTRALEFRKSVARRIAAWLTDSIPNTSEHTRMYMFDITSNALYIASDEHLLQLLNEWVR